MSQIEHDFRQLLSKSPEIEICYQKGLINRRSLARYLIDAGLAKDTQLEAVIAMLRRFKFKQVNEEGKNLFKNIRIRIKDKITIFDFEKSKEVLKRLQKLIAITNYDKGDTLKIVIGSSSIKVFIDQVKEQKAKEIFEGLEIIKKYSNLSEMSLMFPAQVTNTKGILSTITREFVLNDIVITEFLTATPELLIYLKEDLVIKAYEIIKRI